MYVCMCVFSVRAMPVSQQQQKICCADARYIRSRAVTYVHTYVGVRLLLPCVRTPLMHYTVRDAEPLFLPRLRINTPDISRIYIYIFIFPSFIGKYFNKTCSAQNCNNFPVNFWKKTKYWRHHPRPIFYQFITIMHGIISEKRRHDSERR